MSDGSLVWSDESWRDRYYGRPTRHRLPRGYRSKAMRLLDRAEKRRLEQLAVESEKARAHVGALRERDEIAKWRDMIEQFGATVVVEIMRHVDPHFELPRTLRPDPVPQSFDLEKG